MALVLTAGAALWIADTGFARLVRTIYPLKGWVGLALILWLWWTRPVGPAAGPPGGDGPGRNPHRSPTGNTRGAGGIVWKSSFSDGAQMVTMNLRINRGSSPP